MSTTKILDYTITKPGAARKAPTNKVNAEPLTDAEIDSLLENLTSDEIEKLLEDVDPDDTHMPPSARCTYQGLLIKCRVMRRVPAYQLCCI